MERVVEMKIAKFNILSILDCYRLFPLIYISYDSEGIAIQGSCEEMKESGNHHHPPRIF